MLGFYVVVMLIGLARAGVIGVVRIHVAAFGVVGFVAALPLIQRMVALIGWMRRAPVCAGESGIVSLAELSREAGRAVPDRQAVAVVK